MNNPIAVGNWVILEMLPIPERKHGNLILAGTEQTMLQEFKVLSTDKGADYKRGWKVLAMAPRGFTYHMPEGGKVVIMSTDHIVAITDMTEPSSSGIPSSCTMCAGGG